MRCRTRTRRVACSMTARTYIRVPVRVTVSKKSAARIASACERRNVAQPCEVPVGRRVDAGVVEDLPNSGGGDLDAQDEEFTVDAAVPPRTVLPSQA